MNQPVELQLSNPAQGISEVESVYFSIRSFLLFQGRGGGRASGFSHEFLVDLFCPGIYLAYKYWLYILNRYLLLFWF